MKVFNASYSSQLKYGGYENKEFVIVATSESVALGLALHELPKSEKEDWSLTEIPLDDEGVHFVSSCAS